MNTDIIQQTQGKEESPQAWVTLTPKAVEMVKSAMKKESRDGQGLRVAVVGGGCSGFQYGLDFEDEQKENDVVVEQSGIKIYLDEVSAQYLKGTIVDYVVSLQKSGFKFVNPNATRTCGCGESFS